MRAAINAAYRKIDAAMTRKDLAVYKACLSSNFRQINHNGETRDRESYLQNTALTMSMSNSITYQSKVRQLAMRGGDVVVVAAVQGAFKMKAPGSGLMVSTNVDEVDEDTWTRSGSGWVQKQSKTLSLK